MSRDAMTENWLAENGAKFSFHENFDLTKIDTETSHRNQARIGVPIDEDTVMLYAVAMEQGADFPPSVLYKTGERYVTIDGNHRHSSATLVGRKTFPAYVVENVSPALVALLTYNANTRHGKPTSLNERIRQAVLLVEMGATQKAAATVTGIPLRRLTDAVSLNEADKRLMSLGVRKWDSLNRSIRLRLQQVRSDRSMKAAASLAVQAKLGTELVNRLVTEINRYRNESEQSKVIQNWANQYSGDVSVTAGGVIPIPRPVQYINNVLSRVEKLDVSQLDNKHVLTEDYRKKMVAKTMSGVERLQQIANALKHGK